jgi:serine/threonine-protein kinase
MDRWERIEHAYHGARGLSAEQRARFLEEQCGADAALRQQVDVLLAQDDSPGSLLSQPVVDRSQGGHPIFAEPASLIGRSIGPYRVLEHIGSGGMGEVYRACDAKLNRDVALKVLPPVFALDAERLARFGREAQVLASLNHPNIAAIYGFEESDGMRALVLELVDGPTLAERIARGPMPIDDVLPVARQIAKAFEAAHEHGIVHRDLKPANVKVRPDGTVKVLDFGLAKALDPTADVATTSNTPSMTQAGIILGTPAYMSPEQTKGRSVDKRSDVWAFGCVLYEMLTGKRTFAGEGISDTLAAILRSEPDWTALPVSTPAPVRALLEGCLEKDRHERLADVSAARFLLDPRRLTTENGDQTRRPPKAPFGQVMALGACVLVAAIAAGTAGWYLRPSPSTRSARFTVTPTSPLAVPSPFRDIDISPDGGHIVYNTGTTIAKTDLWVRAVDQLDAVRLPGLDAPWSPFFSADGRWIGFFSRGELRKVPINGGSSVSLGPAPGGPQGASWNSRNTIVFATTDLSTGLLTVSADGGTPAVLTRPNPADGEIDHLFPSFLPSGEAVLFTIAGRKGTDSQVAVLDLKTGARKTLIRGGTGARYLETGHLVYASAGGLRAVRFDPIRLTVLSEPVLVVEHLLTKATGAPEFSVSDHGTLVYVTSAVTEPQRSLVWVDRQGREERINAPPRAYVYPRLSPDGTRVALDVRDQENDIWVWDLAHETLSRLTADSATDVAPVWTPDGDIIFASTRTGAQDLYRQPADGSRPAQRLTTSTNPQFPLSISPDGTQLVVRQATNNPVFPFDLFLLHLNNPGSAESGGAPTIPRPLSTPFPKDNGVISPDGHWLAFESSESSEFQIYVAPFPEVNRRHWQVSSAGGRSPLWAPNGRELFYLDGNGFLTRVPVDTSSSHFTYGKPTRMLHTSYYAVQIRTYDVSRDGQKFLMIKDAGAADPRVTSPGITVVQSWFDDLKRRAP